MDKSLVQGTNNIGGIINSLKKPLSEVDKSFAIHEKDFSFNAESVRLLNEIKLNNTKTNKIK